MHQRFLKNGTWCPLTQQYKALIKGKSEQSGERSSKIYEDKHLDRYQVIFSNDVPLKSFSDYMRLKY